MQVFLRDAWFHLTEGCLKVFVADRPHLDTETGTTIYISCYKGSGIAKRDITNAVILKMLIQYDLPTKKTTNNIHECSAWLGEFK